MAKQRAAFNPFYALLVVLGLVFLITACAYGVMAFRAVSASSHARMQTAESSGLMDFMDQHGMKLLAGELALLALASFAAMLTDSYWTARASRKRLNADADIPARDSR